MTLASCPSDRCRHDHQSGACGSRRTCPDDYRVAAQRGRTAADPPKSATTPHLLADPHRAYDVTGREADACRRLAIDGDPQLRSKPVNCSARRSAMPSTPRISDSALPREARERVEIGPKDPNREIAGVPPSPSSIRIPSGVVNSTAIPGRSFQLLAHVCSRSPRSSRLRSGFSATRDVRQRVRHRILGALGSSGPPHRRPRPPAPPEQSSTR